MRPEIQGLRALAVLLVVVYHLWPDAVPGGYVGVDVFFVVSGFLISGHLFREIVSTGRLRVGEFWARRARRLLPASFTVLGLSGLATWWVVPDQYWRQYFTDIAGASAYGLNWLLARSSVDYSAAENDPSPVQHFWSLSVEEQFYAVWPLLLVLVALPLAMRRAGTVRVEAPSHASLRRAFVLVCSLVVGASFVYSVARTQDSAASAYFLTTTRVWEFGAGALLALGPARTGLDRRVSYGVSLMAALGLVWVGVRYSSATPFPGVAAVLPVGLTLAVIWIGASTGRLGRRAWYSPSAVQRLGDLSYSVYLWHWPLIVLAPFVLRRDNGPVTLVAILALTVALSALSKRYVEDVGRRASPLAGGPPWWTFVAVVTSMAVLLGGCWLGIRTSERREAALLARTAAVLASGETCLGAAAWVVPGCPATPLGEVVVPGLEAAPRDAAGYCMTALQSDRLKVCEFGASPGPGVREFALVGDSHAAQWQAALEVVAQQESWHVTTMLKGSCPYIAARRSAPDLTESCESWFAQAQEQLRDLTRVTDLITSDSAPNTFIPEAGLSEYETAVRGYLEAWRTLPGGVRDIWVLRDTPRQELDGPECIARIPAEELATSDACALPESEALFPDPAVTAAERVLAGDSVIGGRRVHVLDLTRYICRDGICPTVIGSVLVLRDSHHMTRTFARTLAPYLREQFAAR